MSENHTDESIRTKLYRAAEQLDNFLGLMAYMATSFKEFAEIDDRKLLIEERIKGQAQAMEHLDSLREYCHKTLQALPDVSNCLTCICLTHTMRATQDEYKRQKGKAAKVKHREQGGE